MKRFKTICAAVMALTISATAGSAATCGNTGAGFDAWKASFSKDAKKAGVKANGLAALAGATYATKTIAADRNQKSFKYSLEKFMKVRGSTTIISQGRKKKAKKRGLL